MFGDPRPPFVQVVTKLFNLGFPYEATFLSKLEFQNPHHNPILTLAIKETKRDFRGCIYNL